MTTNGVASQAQVTLPDLAEISLIKEKIIDDILMSLFGSSPSLDTKVEQVFAVRHPNYRFPRKGYMYPIIIPAAMLLAPHGYSKTSIIRDASKAAADLLGLNFLDSPPAMMRVTKDDFVFASISPSLLTPPSSLHEVFSRATTCIHNAAGGTCLFDDLPVLNDPACITPLVLGLLADKGTLAAPFVRNTYVCATCDSSDFTENMYHALAKKFEIMVAGPQPPPPPPRPPSPRRRQSP